MQTQIRLVDANTETVLFEGSFQDLDKAYELARSYDELGLEVILYTPTITETLARELGYSGEEFESYQESVQKELCDHDASSCATTANKGEGV